MIGELAIPVDIAGEEIDSLLSNHYNTLLTSDYMDKSVASDVVIIAKAVALFD